MYQQKRQIHGEATRLDWMKLKASLLEMQVKTNDHHLSDEFTVAAVSFDFGEEEEDDSNRNNLEEEEEKEFFFFF